MKKKNDDIHGNENQMMKEETAIDNAQTGNRSDSVSQVCEKGVEGNSDKNYQQPER